MTNTSKPWAKSRPPRRPRRRPRASRPRRRGFGQGNQLESLVETAGCSCKGLRLRDAIKAAIVGEIPEFFEKDEERLMRPCARSCRPGTRRTRRGGCWTTTRRSCPSCGGRRSTRTGRTR